MAAPLQAFESSWKKDIERKQLKEARERYLEKAKDDYERREKKKEDARKRGEGTWMLPSVSDRVEKDEQKLKKRKLKKEKKKKKKKKQKSKDKKSKKKKHKHAKSDTDSSSDSSSDSESDAEEKWETKTATPEVSTAPAAGPKLERQDWMVDPMADLFGGMTRDQLKEKKKKESGIEEEKPIIDTPGQHERELNPYWKDGGAGLPEEDPNKTKKSSQGVAGDAGLSWLKKAYQRCEQTAKEDGRTLEEVAAERYGSLKKLQKMIADAEKKLMKSNDTRYDQRRDSDFHSHRHRGSDRGSGRGMSGRFIKPGEMAGRGSDRPKSFMKPGEDFEREPRKKKFAFMKPGEDSETKSSSASNSQGWRRRNYEEPGSVPRWKKFKPEASQSSESERGRQRDDNGRRSRSRERRRDSDRSVSQDRSGDRQRDRSRSRERRERNRSWDRNRSRDRDRSRSRSRDRQRDRSKERSECRERKHARSRSKDREKLKRSRSRSRDRHQRRSHSSSSDSSSDSEASVSSEKPESESKPEPEPVRILTEDEMNAIGAKILRAEMMGNEEMANKLKTELEEARKAKASVGAAAPSRPAQKEKKGPVEVMLTTTDRAGNVWPLQAVEDEEQSGKKKKKKKIVSHNKAGERMRYFADDDKHNLQDLVRHEKMSTAEDSNRLFARSVSKVSQKLDQDGEVDHTLKNMSFSSTVDSRAKLAAIQEHHRVKKAIEECKFCFENIPKHLIIAIGLKVILCLPAHRSMVPSHCLLIPMQHTSSGTAVEEDVWAEIQVFRKGLTAMFKEEGEDVVFMETSMHLQRIPHMVVEVIPMPSEVGEMAPIYFKKAIQESDTEWSQNKKLIDMSGKNVRNSVPKGFPYFCVDFGLQSGFAHVIEDEKIFPSYFGREICGGMMDIEPSLWRKPHKEEFEQQRQKVLQFAKLWKPYDWTQKLKADEDSDSN